MLGVDDATLALAAAAMRGGHDEIALIDATASRAAEAKAIAGNARPMTNWENALDTSSLDAVLVAADQPMGEPSNIRVEQLRRLIQAGMPLIVSHPISLSMLECYELEMIREESHSVVLPYLPAQWHPAAIQLQSLVEQDDSAEIGSIEQIVFERFLPVRNRETVLRQFAMDADLLQFVAGPATKLHALGTEAGKSAGPYLNLTVQMTSARGLVCRWSVSPAEAGSGSRLTVIGAHGKAVMQMPDRGAWQLEVRGTSNMEDPHWDPAAMALEKLAAAMQSEQTEPTWAQASRTVELAETIDRSLAKGRTIDLHQEEFTDIGTFKGTMTSIGCGLLVAGLVLVVVVALLHLLAVQAGWGKLANLLDHWPILLLVVCGLYLLLQPLAFIGRPRQTQDKGGNESRR